MYAYARTHARTHAHTTYAPKNEKKVEKPSSFYLRLPNIRGHVCISIGNISRCMGHEALIVILKTKMVHKINKETFSLENRKKKKQRTTYN